MTNATTRLVDRLRGMYVIPVNDGAGPLNGAEAFARQFPSPPIQQEAAERIEELEKALADCVDGLGSQPGYLSRHAIAQAERALGRRART